MSLLSLPDLLFETAITHVGVIGLQQSALFIELHRALIGAICRGCQTIQGEDLLTDGTDVDFLKYSPKFVLGKVVV